MQDNDKYIAIDEEGYPLIGDLRIQDPVLGAEILENISFVQKGPFKTKVNHVETYVEAFDDPYVALHIERHENIWSIILAYNLKFEFSLESLTVDDWDRFHGFAKNGVPFVMSRQAQAGFFNQLDDYDDTSITAGSKKLTLPPWISSAEPVESEKFWNHIYQTETPRWELNEPARALKDMLPRIKLPPSRIIVPGCGSGNDAAYFAQHGHFVTAIDISKEAIDRAEQKYGHIKNLKFIHGDVFQLPHEMHLQFDLVFEHTCYCAVEPSRRNELVGLWRKLLQPQGHLFAIMFAMERRGQPPFGGTEWEIRERLRKGFNFIFWSRWRNSIEFRKGREVFIYAQKK